MLSVLAGAGVSLAQAPGAPPPADAPKGNPAEQYKLTTPHPEGWMAQIDGTDIFAPDIRMGDKATIDKIIDEGKNRSQVMKHLEHLTKQIGPRLTGSANAEKANRWCGSQYTAWGLTNVQVEEWGTIPVRFDRGPSVGRIVSEKKAADGSHGDAGVEVLRELEFTTPAWSPGTKGISRGRVVAMPKTEEEYNAAKASLKGAWVVILKDEGTGMRRGGAAAARSRAAVEARRKVAEEHIDPAALPWEDRMLFDGILGYISSSNDERVWTGAAPDWRKLDAAKLPTDVFVTVRQSDYDYLVAGITDKKDMEVEFDLQNTFTAGPISCYNTIAEIKGTEKPDEVVIVSAHLDSWNGPGSEGCTDNGTGSSVTLEAARILAAVGAKPKRTIRFCNWTGEEQGLLGSRGYVEKHKDDLTKTVSACFVDDGGTNYEGGLKALENMVPMLAAATAPINSAFPDMKVNVQTVKRMPRGGASDHASFNAIGVPGFFWDEVGRADYGYGWHTQHDKLDLAIPEYLVQSATCAAVTAYNLACADTLLPRQAPTPEGEDSQDRPRRRPDAQASAPAAPAPAAAPAAPKPRKKILP
jgi:hypothetical protein